MWQYALTTTDAQHEALVRRSQETGVSMATLIRRGIDCVLSGAVPCYVGVSGTVPDGVVVIASEGRK